MKRLGGFALILALLNLALTLGPVTDARASGATSVSGVISTDTTWTAAESPYLMVGNVGVDVGVTLTIEPGVTVEAQGNYTLQVAGKVVANGTTDAPVFFQCVSNTRSCWGGIQFTAAQSGSIFDHVDIANASTGLHTEDKAWTLTNSRLHDNGEGIHAVGGADGIAPVPVGTVQHTYIDNNNRGVYVFFPLLQFDHNTVTANGTGMYFLGHGDVVHNNNILGNTTWNAYACFFSGDSSVDATANWWGTSDPTQIAATICDHKDNLNYPTISFDPPRTSLIDGSPVLLSTTVGGVGAGTISSAPGGITCPGTCTSLFDSGTAVMLTASPDASSTFTGWSGACSGTGTCQVTMTQARSVTATFALKTFTLDVAQVGTGTGSVASSPAGIGCGSDCSETYDNGTVVTLTATPAASSTFTGWSGACSGTGTCQVTMTQARSVTATFALKTFTLDVAQVGTGTGSVASSPAGIGCGSDCSETYDNGTVVTLTATPAASSTFTGWSGACSGTGTCQVTMTQARSVTATFALNMYQPDSQIGATKVGPYAGNDMYNSSGLHQLASKRLARGRGGSFYIRLENDGNTGDTYALSGEGSSTGFRVHYYLGTIDVTADVTGGGLLTGVAAGQRTTLRVDVTVTKRASVGTVHSWRITAASTSQDSALDVVKANVRVA